MTARSRTERRRFGRAGAVAALGAALAIVAFAGIRDAASSSASIRLPAARPAPMLTLSHGFARAVRYRELVKDYEFTGSRLPAGWSASAGDSHGFQATMFQPSRVRMTGSSAALSAVHEPLWGYPYQSGWISTEGAFSMSYGMVDFRAKMPAGQGLWSGLWLDQPDHSNPWGEIDVQEMLLGDTHTVYGSLHNWAPDPYWGELQSTVMAADASQGFHDYQVVWQPGYITWAVDGVPYAQYSQWQAAAAGQSWPFDDGTGFYLIADLAVGGPSDWGGAPNSSTVFPATMQLQSVKVWE
jgi:beta-glucanase (GH16 family)